MSDNKHRVADEALEFALAALRHSRGEGVDELAREFVDATFYMLEYLGTECVVALLVMADERRKYAKSAKVIRDEAVSRLLREHNVPKEGL